ncbi:GNAT family N-acetyltransferase [Halobacillus locisalis]|uniref:GNAT family N-acetyltransferase n=1 Tax=Halobacillus locisalis TaxID=220753 RepID=A0A838CS61_9BACI|nr:GNAT family N-acetyltransferase [Halobacillus locisalis]MBA2174791.1 GNAT family N-acetyltransferase [Halobacillus locisalis]
MNLQFIRMLDPQPEHVDAFNRWENDAELIPLTRPHQDQVAFDRRVTVTKEELLERLENHRHYLIYLDDQLIGEMNYMIDPPHLYSKEAGTAWIGITIGESTGRGKGIGYQAITYLEEQIKEEGLNRIELGVFEFNEKAEKLYRKMGYREIARLEGFTYWKGQMWSDIRMEKRLE